MVYSSLRKVIAATWLKRVTAICSRPLLHLPFLCNTSNSSTCPTSPFTQPPSLKPQAQDLKHEPQPCSPMRLAGVSGIKARQTAVVTAGHKALQHYAVARMRMITACRFGMVSQDTTTPKVHASPTPPSSRYLTAAYGRGTNETIPRNVWCGVWSAGLNLT